MKKLIATLILALAASFASAEEHKNIFAQVGELKEETTPNPERNAAHNSQYAGIYLMRSVVSKRLEGYLSIQENNGKLITIFVDANDDAHTVHHLSSSITSYVDDSGVLLHTVTMTHFRGAGSTLYIDFNVTGAYTGNIATTQFCFEYTCPDNELMIGWKIF